MSIIGSRVLGGAGQQPYLVGRSLRFRSSASAYLNRTPAAASNRKTWTWSGWVKRGGLGVQQGLFLAGTNGVNDSGFYFVYNDKIEFYTRTSSAIQGYVTTNAVYRDPSAWYHLVVVYDSTNATSANRMLIYINGISQTLTVNNTVPLNTDGFINNNVYHTTGALADNSATLNGYLAEINFIDGQALTPSSFGAYDNNGVWQPRKYGGTYGTNGFYLPFSNTTSTTTLVQDSSGNGNNWTPNNISLTVGTTYDSMLDSPTVSSVSSNYAVLNPLPKNGVQNGTYTTATISNGNLLATGGAINTTWTACSSMVLPTTGKWYFEFTMSATAYGNGAAGLFSLSNSSANCYARLAVGVILNGSTSYAYTGYNTGSANRIGIAYDADNNKYWQTDINGTWLNSKTPGVDTTGLVSGLTAAGDYVVGWWYNSGGESNLTASVNFGQQPFSYTQPTGFNALNTYNLPQPTIMNGAKYMAATLYTGNGGTQSISNSANGVSFQPDLVWTKARSAAYNNWLLDAVRGSTNVLISNLTNAEGAVATSVTSLNSNGFSVGNAPEVNGSGVSLVGWQWNAGSGTTSTNTSGSISSLVSVNPTAGFSIVSWTNPSTAQNYTIGHGLNATPSMIITKDRAAANFWVVWQTALSAVSGQYLVLNSTAATVTAAPVWGGATPTSSVFSTNSNNIAYFNSACIAYCWSAVAGYSAFGSYTGNGSTDGPFVFTGFRPRYILIKRTDSTADWYVYDTSRAPYNATNAWLQPDTNAVENSSTTWEFDILSNGFKVRNSGAFSNASGGTYIYAAFAENPFKISRAR